MGLEDESAEHHGLTTLDNNGTVNRALRNCHVATTTHGRLRPGQAHFLADFQGNLTAGIDTRGNRQQGAGITELHFRDYRCIRVYGTLGTAHRHRYLVTHPDSRGVVVQHHDLGCRQELNLGLACQQVDKQSYISAVGKSRQGQPITASRGWHRRVEAHLGVAPGEEPAHTVGQGIGQGHLGNGGLDQHLARWCIELFYN